MIADSTIAGTDPFFFLAELQRRDDIRGRAMNPARRLQEEVESSVFFYESAVKNDEQKEKDNHQD